MVICSSEGIKQFQAILVMLASRGAGGGTRTHTTLPSRDFKSLASTSSATSALLISIAFLPFARKCFAGNPSCFANPCSRLVLDPAECADDVLLSLDVAGVVLAHRFRLVADQVCDLLVAGAVALPPSGVGD